MAASTIVVAPLIGFLLAQKDLYKVLPIQA